MHSIRTRITFITLMAIVVSVLAVGVVSLSRIRLEEDRNASRVMRLICDNQRKSLNVYHPTLPRGADLNAVDPALVEAIRSQVNTNSEVDLVRYHYENIKRQAACATLESGLKLFVVAPETPLRFAVVMMDCNELKAINDVCGHGKGDLHLQTACRVICDAFSHSAVFRMGGDEFAAILQYGDYDDRDRLIRAFRERADRTNAAASEPWERVGLALGLAVYDPASDRAVEDVLRRADLQMYEEKARMKGKTT